MTDESWTDRIVGERMTVDRRFSDRVTGSRFSNQEWSLIMTATRFEIDHPTDQESARLVADTERVEQILPELETIRSQTGTMGPGADRGRSGSEYGSSPASGSGGLSRVIDTIRGVLGFRGGNTGAGDSDDEERRAAERLTEEYARELQAELEENGRWDEIRRVAASESEADAGADPVE